MLRKIGWTTSLKIIPRIKRCFKKPLICILLLQPYGTGPLICLNYHHCHDITPATQAAGNNEQASSVQSLVAALGHFSCSALAALIGRQPARGIIWQKGNSFRLLWIIRVWCELLGVIITFMCVRVLYCEPGIVTGSLNYS